MAILLDAQNPNWRDEATGRVHCIDLEYWVNRADLLDYCSDDDSEDEFDRDGFVAPVQTWGTKDPTSEFWSASTCASMPALEPIPEQSDLELHSHECVLKPHDFQLCDRIGQGRTAVVCKGYLKYRKAKEFAIKQLSSLHDDREVLQFFDDISALRLSPHPHIVEMCGVILGEQSTQLVVEYCGGGSCYDLIHGPIPFSDVQAGKICTDVAEAMSHLHALSPKVLHGNLTSRNVLLAHPIASPASIPHAKVCDYQLASFASNNDAARTASLINSGMAPELMGSGMQSEKADVYSFAMFMYELLYRRTPFEGDLASDLASRIIAGERPLLHDEHVDTLWAQILCASWAPNPSSRPSFATIKDTLFQVPTFGRHLSL